MAKVPTRYLQVDPWAVTESGFHADRSEVSESIFSLGNEYMGTRGYFEEGYSGKRMLGSYFNGVFDERHVEHVYGYNGFVTREHFMVNSVDWLYTRLILDDEQLDLATSQFSEFTRTLDLRSGTLTRSFIWQTRSGKQVRLTFQRVLSMVDANLGMLRITAEPLNFSGTLQVTTALDFSPVHIMMGKSFWNVVKSGKQDALVGCIGQTINTRQHVFSAFAIQSQQTLKTRHVEDGKLVGLLFGLRLKKGQAASFDKLVVNLVDKRTDADLDALWSRGMKLAGRLTRKTFDTALAEHAKFWADTWTNADVTIDGDDATQQGVRFCIFQLTQTYHGVDPTNNVGAKGLTGEMYNGQAWWDTESYCLPFYLFTRPKAARNLLGYRYKTLPQAVERSGQLDCRGARYPMCTIDGTESCPIWQHGDLEIHVSEAIAYGIWHYMHISRDTEFLYKEGIEMLLQICRYYASAGGWGQISKKWGYYGVMGPDEFHLMVNNNYYTNDMARRSFLYTLDTVAEMKKKAPTLWAKVAKKVKLGPAELNDWKHKAQNTYLPMDKKTGVLEQHEGYFNLPHLDIDSVPPEQFPLYRNWAYIRIFRYDMIKQPDILLLPFFFSQEFSLKQKKANYEYYEPRCIHESSLSPGIHAILAAELGKHEHARKYSLHAFRLDLDDYNRNSQEGLHTTSMAAAWMNVVYGRGGMRSDGDTLVFNPSMPKEWNSFSFRIVYRDSLMQVNVDKNRISFQIVRGPAVPIVVYGKKCLVDDEGVSVKLPAARRE